MKLEIGDQIRERPNVEDSLKPHQQNIKAEMENEFTKDAEKTSAQWNIPGEPDEGLGLLMSRLSLATECEDRQRLRALSRLVRVALSRADREELAELARSATHQYRPDFVRHLGRLFDRGSKAGGGQADAEPAKRVAGRRSASGPESVGDKPKRDAVEELKDENDLCPRSPMRPQHQRPNNFPYQNTSRNHHSGGIMSAVAYSDAVGPTPQYHNLPSYPGLGSLASCPPLIAETSNMVTESTPGDLDTMVNLSEGDLQILMSLAVDLCPKISPDYDTLPESILEINSSPESREVDHRVPAELLPSPAPLDPWGPGYYDDSTSGCSSLSPASLHSPSPASRRLVPDDSAPNMSPPGQFFDDRLPSVYALDLNVYAKTVESFRGDRSPGSSGYSSTGIPSPTEYPPANQHSSEDFDTKVQIASNDYFCNLDEDFNSDYLLPEFENVFDYASTDVFASTNPETTSNYTATTNIYTPATSNYTVTTNVYTPATSNYTATTNAYTPATSNYTATTNAYTPAMSNYTATTNDYTPATSDYTAATSDYTATTNDYTPATSDYTATTGDYSNAGMNCVAQNAACSVVDYAIAPSNASADGATYTALLNAPSYAAYADATPSTVNASNLKLAAAKLVSPAVSNLKRLEPKVEHYLRAETGRDRILKMMDKKKKAMAWASIALKINELAKQDEDGDTQLMILYANPECGAQDYVLEYTYAMVEMSKAAPRALTAVNNRGQSALYLAALHGDHPVAVRYVAETLVELGEDVAHTTEGGGSLLHELCRWGDRRYDILVELLSLKNQAGQPYFNVNQYNDKGLTPLHVAVKSHGTNNITSLMTVQLLMAERADILLPERTQSNTALHLAILKSCAPRLVEVLLRGAGQAGGRACNILNYTRDSCLHCAASRNDLSVVQQMRVIQLLLENGAVKSLNAGGKFPIALVAEERRQEIRRVYETRKGGQGNVGTI